MEKLADTSLASYLEALGSKSPYPGGGGTAALAGALGASLGQMVGSLTVGKKKYAAVEEKMQAAVAKASALSQKLLGLVDRDAEVFAPLAKAYSLPKETKEERAYKDKVMEKCLRNAAAVPYEILKTLADVVPLISFFAENGSALALSDAGCGAVLTAGAAKSAYLNVAINAKLMQDREYAYHLSTTSQRLCMAITEKCDDIYLKIAACYL